LDLTGLPRTTSVENLGFLPLTVYGLAEVKGPIGFYTSLKNRMEIDVLKKEFFDFSV